MFLRNKKQKFSIRKLSAGAASVLVATSMLGGAAVKANSIPVTVRGVDKDRFKKLIS
ncbi:antiphagocytic cell surface-anchored fibrinogen-and IgG Fc-binding protein SeM [Streptococcus equi subsp. zooepidemicus]|uniref:YSIRK-type signal peptide-containing protein n=1 Tax=Streptococcus equi TaxID=1336 RepID=UPI0010CAC81F|nr:antiphagocytic cell surface-anchored fibrinogen-and IgG Fc-binding protein SeM [Streptococcus equi subsp. zooepidemicus]